MTVFFSIMDVAALVDGAVMVDEVAVAGAAVMEDAAAILHDQGGDSKYGDSKYDGNSDHGGSNDHDEVHSMKHADAEAWADGVA